MENEKKMEIAIMGSIDPWSKNPPKFLNPENS